MTSLAKASELNQSERRSWLFLLCACLLVPLPVPAEILWSGDFETGNFMQWHTDSDKNVVSFWQMPHSRTTDPANAFYGAPIPANLASGQLYAQSGDGSWAGIVTSPTRFSRYAGRFTVKNSINGKEPADCDDDGVCTRRRTELTMQSALPKFYNAMPYLGERWLAFSIYIPSNWEPTGSGFGPIFYQVKPLIETGSGLSPTLAFQLQNSYWKITHRWSPIVNPSLEQVPWQYGMFYAGDEGGAPYPRSDNWPDGLRDFPNVDASYAALKSVRKGGWTDWIIHYKSDARGASEGGTGFMEIWKREDSGPWVEVLDIRPKKTTRGGMTFDHGVWYNSPPTGTSNGGFGMKVGLYMDKSQVWNNKYNREVFLDNVKVGGANATFSSMAPDGAALDGTKPLPPSAVSVN